jgi:16S rRNA (guanine(966)-N(2))-methyltransferase RsmD
MRVISGKFKGRKLKGPEGLELRPTGDRLKESLFNILGPRLAGVAVLDVFSGTGAIGIEALSRGASEAVFIESSETAVRLIQKNLQTCGIGKGYRIVEQDAFAALRALARQGFKANIVFFDPPYDWKLYADLLGIVFSKGLLSQPSRVVVEHYRKAVLPVTGDGYRRSRLVSQGDHCLSFYEEARTPDES